MARVLQQAVIIEISKRFAIAILDYLLLGRKCRFRKNLDRLSCFCGPYRGMCLTPGNLCGWYC